VAAPGVTVVDPLPSSAPTRRSLASLGSPGTRSASRTTMSPRLALATLAVGQPMGQQVYEQEMADRAPGALGPGWAVDRVTVRTLRSPLAGTARIPSRLLADASPLVRRCVGTLLYRGHDVVHRFDLRLPPAPHPEVLTVHDVVSWRFPDEAMPPSDAASSARRAAAVVCPSQFSADEVCAQFGLSACVAIPNGVNPASTRSRPRGWRHWASGLPSWCTPAAARNARTWPGWPGRGPRSDRCTVTPRW